MATNQAGEVALTWADNFIKDLLAESEKYQDVIKDLSTDVITATVSKLDSASEEYRTGATILYNRAVSKTSFVLVEVDEDVNEDAAEVSKDTDRANKEADAETDEGSFNAERATSMVLIEVNADIDKVLDEVRKSNEGILDKIGSWLFGFTDDLENILWGWLPELTSDVVTGLFALPAKLIFKLFTGFFFEETE